MVLIAQSQSAHRARQSSDTKALEEEEEGGGDESSWEMGCWKREGWRV